MIQTKCASCGKGYKLPDAAAGKKARCKACGAVMQIPAAGQEEIVDLADESLSLAKPSFPEPEPDPLAELSAAAGDMDPMAPGQPGAFDPDVSFSSSTRSRRRKKSGPSTKYLVGGASIGAVLLIGIVVTIVVLAGGGEKDKDGDDSGTTGGLALNNNTGVPDDDPDDTDITPIDDDPDDTDTDIDDPIDDDDDPPARVVLTQLLPGDAEVVDWTLPQDTNPGTISLQDLAFRGMSFQAPRGWAMEKADAADEATEMVGRPDDIVLMGPAGERDVRLMVMAFNSTGSQAGSWPGLFKADQMSFEMFPEGLFDKWDEHDELPPLAHAGKEAKSFHVSEESLVSTEYGTLFGGHPFIRFEIKPIRLPSLSSTSDPTRVVSYLGLVGDVMVLFRIDVNGEGEKHLSGLEAMVRSARLLKRDEAEQAAKDDPSYKDWLSDSGRSLAFADSPLPMPGKKAASGGLTTAELLKMSQKLAAPLELEGPRGKGYGIALPDAFEVISKTRTAIRTKPMDSGYWLTMEVHKLSGLDRRQASPLAIHKKSILLRGHRVAIPDGVDVSEVQAERYTVHRLLYPAADDGIRRVAYVMKDGAYLISVIGEFPADKPELLDELDKAVLTVQPVEEEEDESLYDALFDERRG